jgi:hypothetical protein
MIDIRHPEVHVQLTGADGNGFMIIGLVQKALREADVPPEEIKAFVEEATSGDYAHLLQTCMRWVRHRVSRLALSERHCLGRHGPRDHW